MSATRGAVIWMTGLSGAGKSTLAGALHQRLKEAGHASIVLDGDVLRRGLTAGLGFTPEDRAENLRRVAHVAALFMQQGFIAIAAVISPEHQHRRMAREIIGEGFVEVFVNAPLMVCEARDAKGLYARARRGEIPHFTGISGPFDVPLDPDVMIETDRVPIDEAVGRLLAHLAAVGCLPRESGHDRPRLAK
ncbi:putative adenylyl-sulfate kinase [Paraburkholderia domus]|jgi:adenylylsulfate kinase|uniref:Adenylyl-sulfate kinase n=1 Tax=Paraburkholderia domus TaxID=2793075 RepID=A0A9N8MXN3_9BURK|nr:adenylyl-sulfate kinase [Paraburkholderia domus]MBK5050392.1 adenylyl-sulfate kinase [Burkholderia sp. R-70006]MBK5062256.1 adenylyl-sulfate kinase [Burkholderia sp. R-70199]MBK5088004.1 adenylyl-sulfate kinase [Burkholderia sp. R-69927]MBK5120860.1 adenylyl-sulfate kinase [Burkholderia sp. R-69980]MBK5167106.1 adenylyl-sulfate kinase [Burkholderia sp. R-70211]MBK5181550.1 adenylyl-sulfate kinase [Burkholderia sp. R-69749]MCI0146779.1 adenylyl-sulfate kinase [Paraburkholderia sediminicola